MSFNTGALTAYIEQEDFDIVLKAQTEGRTASLIDRQVGVKDTTAMHFMTTAVTLQDGSCSRTALDATTFTNKNVSVGDIAVHENLCTKDLNGFYLQKMVAKGASGEEVVPGEIESLFVLDKMKTLANVLEISDWTGDTGSGTANINKYDGLIKLIDAGSPVNGNTGAVTVATGITVSNIIALLQAMYLEVPENVLNEQNLTIFIGQDVYRLYQMALVNANLFNFISNEDTMTTKLFGTAVTIQGVNGLNGTDRMFISQTSNLLIIMDGDSDEDNWDMWYSKEDKINKFDVTFKRGTGVRFEDEVVEFTLVP